MNFLKVLKKYLIHSQVFVAFCGACLAAFFLEGYRGAKGWVILTVFLSYFCGYVFTKFQTKFTSRLKTINIVSFFFLLMALLILNLPSVWVGCSFCGILGVLYNAHFLKTAARDLPFIKVFYVGFTWAVLNCFLAGRFSFFITFFYISALILVFDIRDAYYDDIQTVPIKFGIQNTKYLAYILLFTSQMFAQNLLPVNAAISFFLSTTFAMVLVFFSDETRPDSYFSILVESCVALPLFFLILLRYF